METDVHLAPACARPVSPVMMLLVPFSVSRASGQPHRAGKLPAMPAMAAFLDISANSPPQLPLSVAPVTMVL